MGHVVFRRPVVWSAALHAFDFAHLLEEGILTRVGLAQEIKQIARWHEIPVLENPPLAHALYRAVEVGQSIPPKLYAVVAEVLAMIFRAQQRVRRQGAA